MAPPAGRARHGGSREDPAHCAPLNQKDPRSPELLRMSTAVEQRAAPGKLGHPRAIRESVLTGELRATSAAFWGRGGGFGRAGTKHRD